MGIVEALPGERGMLYAQFDHLEEAIPRLPLGALKAQTEVLATRASVALDA